MRALLALALQLRLGATREYTTPVLAEEPPHPGTSTISTACQLPVAQRGKEPSSPPAKVDDEERTAPPHKVAIEAGHFTMDGEPFFPLGFYYLWESIGTRFPPRTNTTTNASRWNGGCGAACDNADAWWRWYDRAGFNTFVKGWMGSAFREGYGEMLLYLHEHLNTSIMPIINVGNAQEVINAKSTRAKIDIAGEMARNFANSSLLAYYIQVRCPPLRSLSECRISGFAWAC